MIAVVTAARARLTRSPLAQRLLGGAAWSVFGSVLASGLTLIMLMIVARLLGKEVYGQFIIIQSTLSMVGAFAGFGIGTAATRYAAELKTHEEIRLGHILTLAERTILGFGLLATIGLIVAAGWMSIYLLNSPDLRLPLVISACAVFFTALDSYQKSVLIGFEAMRSFAIGTVIGAVAGFPIMLIAANNFGLQGAAVAIVVNAAIQASVSRYQMTRVLLLYRVPRTGKGCLNELPVLWRFAFPALLSGALVGPAHWTTQAMLANTRNGYADLAVLGIAMQWFNVIMFVPGTAARVVLPILTDHVTKNDHGSSRKILIYAMCANGLIAIPLALTIALLSPKIMILYGDSFGNDKFPLILAAMTAAILAIQTPIASLLAASSRMWLGVLMNSGWAILYLGFSYILVNNGATGIMLALGISYIAHTTWVSIFTIKKLWKT